MKLEYIYIIFIFIQVIGAQKCSNSANTENKTSQIVLNAEKELVEINVTKEFLKKRINIEEIADVEFIYLETKSDFLCDEKGHVVALTDSMIIFANEDEGNIFIFDNNGNTKRKINHKGQSGKEYVGISQALWDDDNREIFVNDMWQKKILVYDFDRGFKRSFRHLQESQYSVIANFNKEYLIVYKTNPDNPSKDLNPFAIVSKLDGNIIKKIQVPLDNRLDISFIEGDEKESIMISVPVFPLMNYGDGLILNEISSDTIYRLNQSYELEPIIARTPPVQEMATPIFLLSNIETNQYFFMWTIKREYNSKTKTGFPATSLVYDKNDRTIYDDELYFQNNKLSTSIFPRIERECFIQKNKLVGVIQAHFLKEIEKDGTLQGKLKEIASQVNENDNPVLMIMKFKE